jgi:hypothetical protein
MNKDALDQVYIIFFKNYESELYGSRVMKVCLTEDIANRKLKEYQKGDDRSNVEYYILPYDFIVI